MISKYLQYFDIWSRSFVGLHILLLLGYYRLLVDLHHPHLVEGAEPPGHHEDDGEEGDPHHGADDPVPVGEDGVQRGLGDLLERGEGGHQAAAAARVPSSIVDE